MPQPTTLCGLPHIKDLTNFSVNIPPKGCLVAFNLRSYRVQWVHQAICLNTGGPIFKVSFEEQGPLPPPTDVKGAIRALMLLSQARPPHTESGNLAEKNFVDFTNSLDTEVIRKVCIVWEMGFDPQPHVPGGTGWEYYANKHKGKRARLIEFLNRHMLEESLSKGLAYAKKHKIQIDRI